MILYINQHIVTYGPLGDHLKLVNDPLRVQVWACKMSFDYFQQLNGQTFRSQVIR
jgi:hypothetical protein